MSVSKWIVYGAGRVKSSLYGNGDPYAAGIIGPFNTADEVTAFAKREMRIPYRVYDLDDGTALMQLDEITGEGGHV